MTSCWLSVFERLLLIIEGQLRGELVDVELVLEKKPLHFGSFLRKTKSQ